MANKLGKERVLVRLTADVRHPLRLTFFFFSDSFHTPYTIHLPANAARDSSATSRQQIVININCGIIRDYFTLVTSSLLFQGFYPVPRIFAWPELVS